MKENILHTFSFDVTGEDLYELVVAFKLTNRPDMFENFCNTSKRNHGIKIHSGMSERKLRIKCDEVAKSMNCNVEVTGLSDGSVICNPSPIVRTEESIKKEH